MTRRPQILSASLRAVASRVVVRHADQHAQTRADLADRLPVLRVDGSPATVTDACNTRCTKPRIARVCRTEWVGDRTPSRLSHVHRQRRRRRAGRLARRRRGRPDRASPTRRCRPQVGAATRWSRGRDASATAVHASTASIINCRSTSRTTPSTGPVSSNRGTVVDRDRAVVGLTCTLDWVLGGKSDQFIELTDDSLTCTLTASCG